MTDVNNLLLFIFSSNHSFIQSLLNKTDIVPIQGACGLKKRKGACHGKQGVDKEMVAQRG